MAERKRNKRDVILKEAARLRAAVSKDDVAFVSRAQ